ncbi:MAG: bifunctional folylpolyglutamate synthase/dihydrofolate synthase [Ignavibacteria bacterium]|nr:bifunctional folylpolyglutamate synthase/dihydrofolate synthase [Ignavibacteria bacterium]
MNKELLDKLFSLRRFGIKPGLERIKHLVETTGSPHKKIRAIHIAGTNGKGSTAGLIASILMEGGYKVGLYTSPHFYSFNERIKINGENISDDELTPLLQKYIALGIGINATFFEITTAIAFEYFANSNTDVVVIETGMGGRYDATNIIDPLLSIITKIDFDHEKFLGTTIKEITVEKAGIIKPGKPAIISHNTEEVYETIIEEKGDVARLIFAEMVAKIERIDINPDKMVIDCHTPKESYNSLVTPLIGKQQAENLVTSILAVETLFDLFPISKECIYYGINRVRQNSGLFGRFELLKTEPPLVIDVAHNPNSIKNVVNLIEELFPNSSWSVVFAVMADKNYIEMLKDLQRITKTFLLPNLKYERAESNKTLSDVICKLNEENRSQKEPTVVYTFDNPIDALQTALSKEEPIFITGSFYLINELTPFLINNLGWKYKMNSDRLVI